MTRNGGTRSRCRPLAAALAGLLLPLLLGACSAPQTRALLESRQDHPQPVLLDVPFFAQTEYQCGPAALAGLLVHRGISTDPEALVPEVFVPALQGTLQPEISAAIRRRGLVAYSPPAGTGGELAGLLRMVSGGSPVLVLQQLGLGPWPQWHYALAIGVDIPGQRLMLHSGGNALYPMPLALFERTWRRARYWAVAALPPRPLPAFAARDPWLQGALELEQSGQYAAALEAYGAALGRWPADQQARLGSGNAAFALGRYREAAQQFHALTTAGGETAAMGWNNLAHALEALTCATAASAAAHHALALAPSAPAVRETVARLGANRQRATAAGDDARACAQWRELGAR